MTKYCYDGPVESFGRCICNRWIASTCATSEKKAKNNLRYQYTKNNNLTANAKVSLPGKLIPEY